MRARSVNEQSAPARAARASVTATAVRALLALGGAASVTPAEAAESTSAPPPASAPAPAPASSRASAPATAPAPPSLPPALPPPGPETYRGRLRLEARVSWAIVNRQGVPDTIRAGISLGVKVLSVGPFALSVDAAGQIGLAELAGKSFRAGGAVEGEWLVPAWRASAYLSAGLHWFVSEGKEDRAGLLVRGALGIRLLPGGRWYVGFEPLGFERLPRGEGPPSPFRSSFAWELAFLVVGYRP